MRKTHLSYMNCIIKPLGMFVLCLLATFTVSAKDPVFPLKHSENHRYLVDQTGTPFFYNADTPWLLMPHLTVEEAVEFINIRRKQGFNALQLHLLPFIPIDRPDVNGNFPFENFDFTKTNQVFFQHADSIIAIMEDYGMLAVLNPVWMDCCRNGWEEVIRTNGRDNCREYGRFVAKTFNKRKNIIWLQGGDKDPFDLIDHYRQIALGILDENPLALQTYHASSGHSSTDVIPLLSNDWMNFTFSYTYFKNKHNVWVYVLGWGELPEVYEHNHREYRKDPVKPFVLGESQYEGEDPDSYAPLSGAEVVRRQAWWSVLSGSCGHAYGSWAWKVPENWRQIQHDKGAWQMGLVRKFFESIAWYELVPDMNEEIVAENAGTYGDTDYITAAYHPNGDVVVLYIPPTNDQPRTFTLDASKVRNPRKIQWFNPADGTYTEVKTDPGKLEFTTTGNNGSGFNDWILILQNSE